MFSRCGFLVVKLLTLSGSIEMSLCLIRSFALLVSGMESRFASSVLVILGVFVHLCNPPSSYLLVKREPSGELRLGAYL